MIRNATTADIDTLCKMARAFHQESGMRVISLDIDVLAEFLGRAIESPKSICLVNEDAGRISGAFLGYVAPFFFSRELGAWDLALYVSPGDRGAGVARALLAEFKAWAMAKGARTVHLGTAAGINPDKTRALYVDVGYKVVGEIFRFRSE